MTEYTTEGPVDPEKRDESPEQPEQFEGPYILTLEGLDDKSVIFVAQEIARAANVLEDDVALLTTREIALACINSIVQCAANNPLLHEAENGSTPNDSGNVQG